MTKRIIALVLTALALICLIGCSVNAVFIVREYRALSGSNAGGADYLGVYLGFYINFAAAFLGFLFSAVAFFIADLRWIKILAAILAALLILTVLIVLAFK